MKDSEKIGKVGTGRESSASILERMIERLNFLKKFIEEVPKDFPVRITLQYQIQNFDPCVVEFVVLVQEIKAYYNGRNEILSGRDFGHRVDCRLLAEKKRYFGAPYPRGSGYYLGLQLDHIIKWEVIPEDDAPRYMKPYPFIEQEFEE